MLGIANAMENYGLERVALLDFDVHHGNGNGNGSENIIGDDKRILFCSTFQHSFYPNETFAQDKPHIICSSLNAGVSGTEFVQLSKINGL